MASLLLLKACFFLPKYLALLGTDGKKLPSDHRLDIEKTKSSFSLNSLVLNYSSATWRYTVLQHYQWVRVSIQHPVFLLASSYLQDFLLAESFRGPLLDEVELALDAAGTQSLPSLCSFPHFLLRTDTTFQQPWQMLFLKMFLAKPES